MKKLVMLMVGLALIVLGAINAGAQQNRFKLESMAVGVKVGTTGIGVDVISPATHRLNAKIGGSWFKLSSTDEFDIEDVDIDLASDLNIFTISALVDFYPFRPDRGLYLTGGLFYKNIKADGDGKPISPYTFEMGGKEREIEPEKLGRLWGDVQYGNHIAPYLGLGFGNAVKPGRRVGFLFELGTMYTNAPRLNFNGEGWIRRTASQDRDIEDALNKFKWYPVLSLGLTYQFLR